MPPAPDLSLPGYIIAHHQLTATVPPPAPIFNARINMKDYPETTSTPGAIQTQTLSPTSIPPYSASIDWSPGVKIGLFLVGAFVCLMLSFILFGIIRKIRDEIRFQRAAEQRIRDTEDRRREAALQWRRLELERHAEDARAWEMLMRQRITKYAEQVEEAEFARFCNTPLGCDDLVQARELCHSRDDSLPDSKQVPAEDEGQQESTGEFSKAPEASNTTGEDEDLVSGGSETHGREASVIEPASDSSIGETVEASQVPSRTELDGSSPTPFSSDEVLHAVNALGYESISDTQRAQARARALKDLEGR